jgi:hypothetical protein
LGVPALVGIKMCLGLKPKGFGLEIASSCLLAKTTRKNAVGLHKVVVVFCVFLHSRLVFFQTTSLLVKNTQKLPQATFVPPSRNKQRH